MLTGVWIGARTVLEVDDVRLTQRTGALIIRHGIREPPAPGAAQPDRPRDAARMVHPTAPHIPTPRASPAGRCGSHGSSAALSASGCSEQIVHRNDGPGGHRGVRACAAPHRRHAPGARSRAQSRPGRRRCVRGSRTRLIARPRRRPAMHRPATSSMGVEKCPFPQSEPVRRRVAARRACPGGGGPYVSVVADGRPVVLVIRDLQRFVHGDVVVIDVAVRGCP